MKNRDKFSCHKRGFVLERHRELEREASKRTGFPWKSFLLKLGIFCYLGGLGFSLGGGLGF